MISQRELLSGDTTWEYTDESAPSPLTIDQAREALFTEYQRIAREVWPACRKALGKNGIEQLIREGRLHPLNPKVSLYQAMIAEELAIELALNMRDAHYRPNSTQITFLMAFYRMRDYADLTLEQAVAMHYRQREGEMAPIVGTILDSGSTVEYELHTIWPSNPSKQYVH